MVENFVRDHHDVHSVQLTAFSQRILIMRAATAIGGSAGESKQGTTKPTHHLHRRQIQKPRRSESSPQQDNDVNQEKAKTEPSTSSASSATTAASTSTLNPNVKSFQPRKQNEQVQTHERQQQRPSFKQHKPQTEAKKHRSESDTIDFIKTLMSKLTSGFDKLTSQVSHTPQSYERTRHHIFKKFSFYKQSPTMQQAWVDILYEQAVERGIYNTIGNLLKEQLEENVSQLEDVVIADIKKKLLTTCQKGFMEQFNATDSSKALEEEYQYYRRRCNNILFIAKLVSCLVVDTSIGFKIMEKLLGTPNELNIRLLTLFLPVAGTILARMKHKKQLDECFEKIRDIIDKEEKLPKILKFELLSLIELREKHEFNNIDKGLMNLQRELGHLKELEEKDHKINELESLLTEWDTWYEEEYGSNWKQQLDNNGKQQSKDRQPHSNKQQQPAQQHSPNKQN